MQTDQKASFTPIPRECMRLEKPTVVLRCPDCKAAVLAFVWSADYGREILEDPETLETISEGLSRGLILETVDASAERVQLFKARSPLGCPVGRWFNESVYG